MEIGEPIIRLIREQIGVSSRTSLCDIIDAPVYRTVDRDLYYDVRDLIWDSVRLTVYFRIYTPMISEINEHIYYGNR